MVLVDGHVGLIDDAIGAAASFSMNEWQRALEWASLSLTLPSQIAATIRMLSSRPRYPCGVARCREWLQVEMRYRYTKS